MRGYHIRLVINHDKDQHSSQTFLPASLFQHLPDHSHQKTRERNESHIKESKDYRLGLIAVDWMDFEQTASTSSLPGSSPRSTRGPAEGAFIPSTRHKSGSTNLPEGVVHIFRETESKPSLEELEAKTQSLRLQAGETTSEGSDGVLLAVLAVPSYMTPSDFLAFVSPVADDLAHLRIIRDFAPNRSIAILKFLSPAVASEFSSEYNGKLFNSMEPEICHVVHVLSVVIDVEDPISQAVLHTNPANSQELPTCPVCLERMDAAVTGLITVPCSHTFHCMCLSKWGDSRCPVCRYSQTLIASHPTPSHNRSRSIPFATPANAQMSRCSTCSSTTNLWICLICGNIGCGRYGQAHAHAHYQATTHLYALELETQRVWDYAGDGYVHRLIQNKTDGKLVELPSAASSMATTSRDHGLGPSQADALSAEKIEAIGIEYSYLLTSQLDSQREYYEGQGSELQVKISELSGQLSRLTSDLEAERARAREEDVRRREEMEERLVQAVKEKGKAEQRAEKATELARKFEKELREEKAVSEGLMKNLVAMKKRVDNFDRDKEIHTREVKELEDQVRDVMFFLEARTKIEQGEGVEGEAAGGSLEVSMPPEPHATAKKKKHKKGR
ncbi:zf-UBP-domain-containing protein [Coprinopsis marcescibilis]|uniref:Zf-UBP-domain-containing protein n=1 Tax=Coprinopsis marcescibilis TaxID=230819 RepID=A0A5C3KFY2_COPMA|nr:zf-UBP-domain-containing protein [Coprinopsis marcescibilis]